MTTNTLYAYVDGYDLDEVATQLVTEFTGFIQGRTWSRQTEFVNDRDPPSPKDKPGDLPRWDLGMKHELPNKGAELPGWFDEIEDIARFLGGLVERSGRQFVVGIADNKTLATTDLFHVASSDVNLAKLRTAIGA